MPYKYETHMHTSQVSACAASSAAEQVRNYKRLGYTGIIVTDHFINGNSRIPGDLSWEQKMRFFYMGFEAAKYAGGLCGLDVFLGMEFTIRGSDFWTSGINLEFLISNPGLDSLPIERYSALVRGVGGFVAQAHPYREAWYIEYQLPVAPSLIDCMEVYNSSMSDETNARALAFAKKHGLPMQSGSDSHAARNFFPSGIEIEKKAGCIEDIISAIKSGGAVCITP